VIDFVQAKILAAARPVGQRGGLGIEVTLRRALEAALPSVDKSFTDQPLIEAELRMTLGTCFQDLGDAKTAAEQFQTARTLYRKPLGPDQPATFRSTHNLATSYSARGRDADAVKLYEEMLTLQRARLGPDHPDTIRCRNGLASNYS